MDRPLGAFFTAWERNELGCTHRLYIKQLEFCDNLIFHQRAVLDALHHRLLDCNRKLGSPDQVAVVFGHRITRQHNHRLQTTLEDLHLGQPVLRAFYKHSMLKKLRAQRQHGVWRPGPGGGSDQRCYRLWRTPHRISLIYLKLFHKLYAPLTSGVIHPYPDDRLLPVFRTSNLDQLYLAVGQALDNLVREIGLELAA